MAKTGLLISRDLFFASKVTGTAAALGLKVRSVGSSDQFRTAAGEDDIGLVILDLECPGITADDVMAAIPAATSVTTVAFGPHVHEAQLTAARNAGFHHVLPRSKFSSGLVDILQTVLKPPEESPQR